MEIEPHKDQETGEWTVPDARELLSKSGWHGNKFVVRSEIEGVVRFRAEDKDVAILECLFLWKLLVALRELERITA